MPRRSKEAALATREQILRRAADVASVEGLDGLTLGRLSGAISMSKSGVFGHFGSKEELQLAVIDCAAAGFEAHVFGQSGETTGLARLVEIAAAWIGYLERAPFRGGCFFAAAAAEFDDRPGRVRDRIIELTRSWLRVLEHEAETARADGELDEAVDPAQLAFEIHAFVQEANWAFQLHGDGEAFRRAHRAIRRTLGVAAPRG